MGEHTNPTKIITNDSHRELIFEGFASETENLSLMIYDDKNPKHKDTFYKIPLYQARPQASGNNTADIELVYTRPLIFDTQDEDEKYISQPPEGYIYVYVDGYLWRELKVIVGEQDNRTFSDVNLAYQKGFLPWKKAKNKHHANQGRRDATGRPMETIVVPNKLRGQQCRVEMAFSESQWSWTQILKFGGMNPEDPRLNHGDPLSQAERACPDEAKAASARQQRMQLLDNLSDFENGFTQSGIIKPGNRVHRNITHFAADKLAPVVLTNGLHVARNHIDAILKLQGEIARLIHQVKGVRAGKQGEEIIVDPVKKANFELAEKMINRCYQMNDAILDGDIKIAGDEKADKLQQEQVKFANKIKAWRDGGINLQKLKTFLHYDKLLELSQEIKAQQLLLVDLIEQDQSAVKLLHCMQDFAYHNNNNYASGIDVLKDIALALKMHPAQQYPTIILDKKDWDNLNTTTTTSSTLLKLVGEHPDEAALPIAELFFGKPKTPATAQKPASIELDTDDHQDPYNPQFSLERLHMVAQDESPSDIDQEATEQIGRRISQAIMGLATNYLDLSLIASANQGQAQTAAALNQQLQSEKADGIATQERLNRQLAAEKVKRQQTAAKLKQAEQALAVKTQGLAKTDAEYQRQHQLAYPEIAKLKTEMGEIDSKLNKAQRSLRNINNQLAHIELEITQKGSAHLSKNKGLMAALRIINQLENGQFTAIEMTAQDYHNGKFSEGFIALNARARAEIAQELSKEIRDLVRSQNNSRTRLVTPNGTMFDTVDDIMHMRSKVNHLLSLAEQAQGVLAGEGAAQLKLEVIALKESIHAQQLATTSLKHEIAELSQAKVKIEADITQNHIANKKLADLAEATEKLANQKFLSSTSVKTLSRANIGVLGAVGLFEVINLTRSFEAFLEQKNLKTGVYAGAAITDFTAVVMTIAREAYVMKTGQPSEKQLSLLKKGDINVPAQVTRWFTVTTWMYRANIAASVFSSALSVYEAYYAIRRGDNDAAFGLATMGVGFVLMARADYIVLRALLTRSLIIGSRLGWIGLLIVLIGAVIYYCFVDEDIQRWFKICPWGNNSFGDDNSASWAKRPDYAYHDLARYLMSPQVHSDNVEKLHDVHTITYSRGMVVTYEDFTQAYLIVSCPTNTAHNNVQVEFAAKPNSTSLWGNNDNDEQYQNLILGNASGQGQRWLQQFWQQVITTSLSGGQGLRIDLNQYVCAPLFKHFNTTRLTFRLRIKTYPHGKGKPVSSAFADNEFVLPISERDEEGKLTEDLGWQTTEVNLSLNDVNLKSALGLN
ncbi:hypothetical protein DXX93_15200 [Thalassotalea euphylliae]|uniref:Uncharacterized protein n=1 Tax=Thalassotalea euphylliae TaxID=1655234 RepID=A0A3E0TSX7_9GAMM|nr:hypothetical protein [Thalassotalea euphylliae]REL27771.1 hypothetical protein DXX93_15200 [Thalassotalea euphylliae]